MDSSTDKIDSKDLSILPVHAENASPIDTTIEPYGPSGVLSSTTTNPVAPHADSEKGFRGIFSSRYVALCAAFSAIGGMLFGYEYVSSPAFSSRG